MPIIAVKTLRAFWEVGHADAEQPLKVWYHAVNKEKWLGSQDIKRCYKSASFLRDNRVVFNIGGNKYRLIVKVHYNTGVVYIRFIGTHAEYDRIDANTI